MPDATERALQDEIVARLAEVRRRMSQAALRAGRDPAEVDLVAVSKRQPLERIVAGVRAGIERLGENFAQEAREKIPRLEAALGDLPPPRWHMLGHVQRNKAALCARSFDVIESVDRPALAVALDRHAGDRVLEVLLQVNLSGEAQKSGVSAADAPALLDACLPLAHLRVVGLMTIPAASDDPERARPVFAQLRALRDTLARSRAGRHLRELSMGMSADFAVAIEEGATRVRIGTAIFGERSARAVQQGPDPDPARRPG